MSLTQEASQILETCFVDAEQRLNLGNRLSNETRAIDKEALPRVQLSILRLIVENPDKGYDDLAFNLARTDWRDLLVAAGHESIGADSSWAQAMLGECPEVVITEPEPVIVVVDETGWARRPGCNYKIKVSDSNAYDEKWHIRCRKRLDVILKTQQR